MIPKVTEWLSPKGLPTASTKSPISMPVAVAQRARRPGRAPRRPARPRRSRRPPGPSSGGCSRPSARLILMAVGRGVADHVPVGQHVVLALQLDNHAGAGLFHVPAAAVWRSWPRAGRRPRCGPRPGRPAWRRSSRRPTGPRGPRRDAPVRAAIRPAVRARTSPGRSRAAGRAGGRLGAGRRGQAEAERQTRRQKAENGWRMVTQI